MGDIIKLVEVYSLQSSKDKIITRQAEFFDCGMIDVSLAILTVVKEDFNPSKKIDKILQDSDSYQIRPKTLYKNTRGIFFIDDDGRRYLSMQERIDLRIRNKELGNFLF